MKDYAEIYSTDLNLIRKHYAQNPTTARLLAIAILEERFEVPIEDRCIKDPEILKYIPYKKY